VLLRAHNMPACCITASWATQLCRMPAPISNHPTPLQQPHSMVGAPDHCLP
jgi:hypothetical protein